MIMLEIGSQGTLFPKCQVTDYVLHGEELEDYSLFSFVQDTYENWIGSAGESGSTLQANSRGPGRPRNVRSQYLKGHPNCGRKHRIVCSAGHNMLPNIIGSWFPRRDDENTYDGFCAAMLVLLKPWRNMSCDLKPNDTSWAAAFEAFEHRASDAEQVVIAGAQYFHECATAAAADHAQQEGQDTQNEGTQVMMDDEENNEDFDAGGRDPCSREQTPIEGHDDSMYTEEGLQALKAMCTSLAEQQNALAAIAAARLSGYFSDGSNRVWNVSTASHLANATAADLTNLQNWKLHMEAEVQVMALAQDSGVDPPIADNGELSVLVLMGQQGRTQNRPSVRYQELQEPERALDLVPVQQLWEAQFRAYDIIVWHLEQMIAGHRVLPLQMIVYGEGGTGKSRVIQTVTDAFHSRESSFLLVKAAYTSMAASLIDGKMMHVIAHINVNQPNGKLSDAIKRALQAYWRMKRYLILDEYSMISKTLLVLISRILAIAMEGSGLDTGAAFGGLNIILCGDLHQFAPVTCSPWEALYRPVDIANDTIEQALGRSLYKVFDKVVILDEQMRVTNPIWRAFLNSLRVGEVTEEQVCLRRRCS